eukprot:SAG11_NODE_12284_length_711_cov_0.702614_1_plen_117_part_10
MTGHRVSQTYRVPAKPLTATCRPVQWIGEDDEVAAFSAIIPMMAGVVKQCLAEGDEDNGCLAIEVFSELIESPVNVLTSVSTNTKLLTVYLLAMPDAVPLRLLLRGQMGLLSENCAC